jgi:MFS transporter, UMF1 family
MLRKFTKEEKGWIMYDWANSAFAAIILAIVLPPFFDKMAPGDAGPWWGYATSIASLVGALTAPFLGTLGDYKGYKMRLFTVFALMGAAATALLAFTKNWQLMLVLYILGSIGFNASNVFYDGFLPDVTEEDRMDMVSSYGYGMGYIGGSTIPLLIALALIMFGDKIGIPSDVACQISFFITAVWWIVFTIPMWRSVKQRHYVEQSGSLVKQTFSRLTSVARRILTNKAVLLFLLAYFFYIDGVGTIIHMASIFGSSMGLGQTELIIILLVVQLVAFPCAIFYGLLSRKWSVRTMLLTGIVTYMVICAVAMFLEPLRSLGKTPLLLGFMALAVLVGTAQGGIQALSRSFFGKLVPPESANEFFGFYDIFGKFSAVLGPFLFGLVWDATQKSYLGVIPVLMMFIVGGGLFLLVPKNIEKLTSSRQE